MATEFDAIFNEFSDELDALAEMADAPAAFVREGVTARARIAAGNAATLLLAAIFEEYISKSIELEISDIGPTGVRCAPIPACSLP